MITCWMCSTENPIADDDYGDHICLSCGVMLTVYNPAEIKKEEAPKTTYDEYMLNRETQQEEEKKMGDLKNWSKENSKFIKIGDGESYEGVYQGYKTGVNMNGEPAIIYKLDGKELKSSSAKLAEYFDGIEKETKVRITRTGEGLQTKWKVEKL